MKYLLPLLFCYSSFALDLSPLHATQKANLLSPKQAAQPFSAQMVRTSSVIAPPPPQYLYQFVMTGPPSQYNRLMAGPTINGPWVQVNQPDGSFGQRVGNDYVLPNTSQLGATLFFTLQPVQ